MNKICEVCDREVNEEDVVYIREFKETMLCEIEEQYVMCKNCYNEYKAKR
jgi:hypothetical protein